MTEKPEFASGYVGLTEVERLVAQFLTVIGSHYREGPISREKVFEILNAVAFVVALTAKATEKDTIRCLAFFKEALDLNLGNPEWDEIVERLEDRGLVPKAIMVQGTATKQ